MKKILIVSTVSRQFFLFEKGNIEVLKSLGYEIHAAANFNDASDRLDNLDIVRHHFDIQRSPFSPTNIKAFKQLRNIIQSEDFNIVHCHAPMGGVLGRVAAKLENINNVIYTAHGFHFFKGAPIINWLFYYPVERLLAKYTDILITINKEDNCRARKAFKAKRIEYIPGVGIDVNRFTNINVDQHAKRKEIGVPEDAFVVLSVGELNNNKNHETILKAIESLGNSKIYFVLCGQGNLESYLKDLSKELGLGNNVKFLGYRGDVDQICKIADVFAFPSKREGLGLSALEAMASGLPIVTSSIHGIVDYSIDGKTGYSCDSNDITAFATAINKLLENKDICQKMGENNIIEAQKYDANNVNKIMERIYSGI